MFSEMRQKIQHLAGEADRRSVAIDFVWEMANSPLYQAWIELMIASRTDAYLRDSIRAVNTRLTEFVQKTFSELFVPARDDLPNLDMFPVMLIFMIEGMAIGADAREKRIVDQVLTAAKNICGALFKSPAK